MKLESYIRNNRDKLDIEKPDEEYLWKGISQALEKKRKHQRMLYFRSIAAVGVILILSVSLAYYIGKNQVPQPVFGKMDPELAKQEVDLLNQISNYSNQIKQASFNPNEIATSNQDIQYIDDLIKLYSEDLKQNGPNEKLINSLLDLYQKKIMILSRMLNEIEKNKNNENRKINI